MIRVVIGFYVVRGPGITVIGTNRIAFPMPFRSPWQKGNYSRIPRIYSFPESEPLRGGRGPGYW